MTEVPPLPYSDRDRMREELVRQYEILAQEKWQRILLTWFGFAICAIYVDPLILLALAVLDTTCELTSLSLMKDLDPALSRLRYRGTQICVIVMEASFGTAAGLVWLVDDPYAKALAAGLVMTTALQLTTVRSIHLPYGLAGIATIGVTSFFANVLHWSMKDDWQGLALSTAAACGGIGYAVIAMLSNHQLHRATAEGQSAARASDTAKSRFLAQMSHELRTPLNAIIGLGQVEADAALTPTSRERLTALVTSARGLAVVLDDVLDLSSITDGRLTLHPRNVDLRAELSACVATFRHQAKAQRLDLDLDLAASLPTHVKIDPQRMRQCLINLISNALKHVRNGGVTISVSHKDGTLQIDVTDTGQGVPPALQEHIFEPFRKGTATVPGTGLGLAISRSLARQMDGDLVLLPGETGACFRLTLFAPIADASDIEPSVLGADLAGRSILVVDDIATNRLVAASLLQASGAGVIEASGGKEALAILSRERVDLVLLDMNMPEMDGFATVGAIRAFGGAIARIPVIAMTADVLPAQRAAFLAAGLDGFLPKPLLPEDLDAVLRRFLPDASLDHQTTTKAAMTGKTATSRNS
jgi:two-component system, sensor histidine kinase